MHNVNVGVLSVSVAQQRDLPRIPEKGIFLKLGETAVTDIDGYPVIITTAGGEMLVAHAREVGTVDEIIETFKRRGVKSLLDIAMSIQLHAPEQESEFIEKARLSGIRHVWALCPFAEFLVRAETQVGGANVLTIQRNN